MLSRFLLALLLLTGFAGCAPAGAQAPDLPAPASRILPSPGSPPPQASPEPSTPVGVTPTIHSPFPTPRPSPTGLPSPGSPAAAATSTPVICRETTGRVETGQVDSGLLHEPLDFRIYLPPCYAAASPAAYPVLYLIHGQSYNDDQWDRLGADEMADKLIASGQAAPFLIVMPRERRWEQPDKNMFGQALVEDLIPFIDSHYRTLSNRRYRAIGGLSRGGGWALHLGLSEWELFGAFGAHSLALFSYDSMRIPGWLDSIPEGVMPRIFLDMDDHDRKDLIESTRWFEELLTQRGILHEWYLFPGYHEENYWAAHVEQYLRWYAAGWPAAEAQPE